VKRVKQGRYLLIVNADGSVKTLEDARSALVVDLLVPDIAAAQPTGRR
jgi:hypothetical protein